MSGHHFGGEDGMGTQPLHAAELILSPAAPQQHTRDAADGRHEHENERPDTPVFAPVTAAGDLLALTAVPASAALWHAATAWVFPASGAPSGALSGCHHLTVANAGGRPPFAGFDSRPATLCERAADCCGLQPEQLAETQQPSAHASKSHESCQHISGRGPALLAVKRRHTKRSQRRPSHS